GHDKSTRFEMGPDFAPISGAEGWQISNPPIIQMAALRAAMDIFDEVGMAKLRAKSVRLTGYLEYLINRIKNNNIAIITPQNEEERGAQLSLRIDQNGKSVFDKLISRGVVCDWREPNVIRLAPAPLYNTFMDVYRFAEILREAVCY
ncbi:MAG: kynureninase, partial [bacterium]